jgi:hypothetical protein
MAFFLLPPELPFVEMMIAVRHLPHVDSQHLVLRKASVFIRNFHGETINLPQSPIAFFLFFGWHLLQNDGFLLN